MLGSRTLRNRRWTCCLLYHLLYRWTASWLLQHLWRLYLRWTWTYKLMLAKYFTECSIVFKLGYNKICILKTAFENKFCLFAFLLNLKIWISTRMKKSYLEEQKNSSTRWKSLAISNTVFTNLSMTLYTYRTLCFMKGGSIYEAFDQEHVSAPYLLCCFLWSPNDKLIQISIVIWIEFSSRWKLMNSVLPK